MDYIFKNFENQIKEKSNLDNVLQRYSFFNSFDKITGSGKMSLIIFWKWICFSEFAVSVTQVTQFPQVS